MFRKQETTWAESQAEWMTWTGGERAGGKGVKILPFLAQVRRSGSLGPGWEHQLAQSLGIFPGDVRHRLAEKAARVTVPFSLQMLALMSLIALRTRKSQDTFILEFSQEKVLMKTTSNLCRELTTWQALSPLQVI